MNDSSVSWISLDGTYKQFTHNMYTVVMLMNVRKVESISLAPDVTTAYCHNVQDLAFLPHCTQLTCLKLVGSNGLLPAELVQLTRLTSLFIYGYHAQFHSFAPDVPVIKSLTQLRELGISNVAHLVDLMPWECMGHLRCLRLDVTPSFRLDRLTPRLLKLTLSDAVNLRNLTDLRRFTHLTELCIMGTVNPVYPLRIETMSRLQSYREGLVGYNWTTQPRASIMQRVLDDYRAARMEVSYYMRGLHGAHFPPYVLAHILDFIPICRYFAYEELVVFARRIDELLGKLRNNKRGLRPTRQRMAKVLRGETIYK